MDQLQLLPEIEKMSKPVHSLDMYREDLSLIGAFDVKIYKDMYVLETNCMMLAFGFKTFN